MKFLIIFVFTLATVYGLSSEELKSRHVVVPAGSPEGRMTRAKDARRGQFPYQVGVIPYYGQGEGLCGGSLISRTEVLTAGHCVINAKKIELILGTINREDQTIRRVKAKKVIIHPKYNDKTLDNDIAIIKIPYTNYTKYIQKVELPTKEMAKSDFANDTGVVTGWGRISDIGFMASTYLQYGEMKIISNKECYNNFKITASHICVSTEKRTSACDGDSGGPLVLKNRNILVGITSLTAKAGCEKRKPVAFTRVTSYLDWILENSEISQ